MIAVLFVLDKKKGVFEVRLLCEETGGGKRKKVFLKNESGG